MVVVFLYLENNFFELPKEIMPFSCDDLVRVGCFGDGGYVVPKFIIERTDFGIVHLAVNDVVGAKEGDMPSCVEITFVNKKYLKSTGYSKSHYPIKGLDYSNGLSCNNLRVKFIRNTYD